ncbi:MAG: DUF2723 domain-containing protein [Anaerolineae bacterium]|nr:DUF2723 domain-containing protein [Anaerolineae bacterium]
MTQNNQPNPSGQSKPIRRRFFTCLIPSIVFILILTLYLATLSPGVVGGDAGEHQFAVPLLGIPHATGYPLYVLVGKLWTMLIPLDSMAWRMNLFSAVSGAVAAALTALVVLRLTEDDIQNTKHTPWAGAVIAGMTLACGLTLWQWSIIAGVRSVNVLFFALMTLLAIIWQQQMEQGNPRAAERTLRWLALTVGLSLAHHRTTLFYLPPLIGWIGWHDRQLMGQPKRLLSLLALAMAPLSLYAFIYFRGISQPPYSHEIITDLKSFWFLVGASDSSDLFLSIDPNFLPARLFFIWRDVLAQLSWPGVILAVIGVFFLLWRKTKYFLFTGFLVLLLFLFVLDFEVVKLTEAPTWYLMPAYFVLAVWVGVGVYAISRITHYVLHFSSNSTLIDLAIALLFISLLMTTLAWPNWQRISTAAVAPLDEWRQLLRGRQAERLVESSMPYVKPGSLILGDWEQYTPFMYYQLINGWRSDVEPRLPLDRWPEQVAGARTRGQPVYFARKTTDLIGTPHLNMTGPLIHLGIEPNFEIPADITNLNANFENELELIGYRARVMPQDTPGGRKAGPILQLMFYWRVSRRVNWNYALSLRLKDATGQEIYVRDATHPVLSSYPTSLWTPGEVVGDFYELPMPPGHGPLTLHLLPYRTEGAGQWHNLTLTGTEPPQDGILLGPFQER